ncbi:SagB family peptide dehydrogenase [Paenibacillus sp. GCM10027626]|uniref:SagB family peptide dehydrogenase n=1 Tax=Paenibacillus sp. GCM10027626 TaxID=3273411 RepID=UPI00362BBA84
MLLDAFLRQLHDEPDQIKPADWMPDWEDAPLPYKLYRSLPIIPLSREIPFTLKEKEQPELQNLPDLRTVGHFLYYVFGLTQLTQSVLPGFSAYGEAGESILQSCRRFVPSGGGLYPSELYIYLKIDDLPAGLYHYDAAHHRLVMLREGGFDDYLSKALGDRCEMSRCFGAVFISTFYWKNFFKYHNFSYRLQGLDAGIVIGQLLEVAKRFGFETAVCFQFLDRAVNHLLGLSDQEEAVYAVIPLASDGAAFRQAPPDERDGGTEVTASALCQEIDEVQHTQYIRSRQIVDCPMLLQANKAARLESTRQFRDIGMMREGHSRFRNAASASVVLPHAERMSYDLADACRNRFSPEVEFTRKPVSLTLLSQLLRETAESFVYRNDLDGFAFNREPRLQLTGCFYGVEGIADGAYCYDAEEHRLEQLRTGDLRFLVHQTMSIPNINTFQVPLSFHVAGSREQLARQLGYRGYRIQQMEVGMLVQRLLLAASAAGLGGRPLLGYDVPASDAIYRLFSRGMTGLIYVPVGAFRQRLRLEGSLSR